MFSVYAMHFARPLITEYAAGFLADQPLSASAFVVEIAAGREHMPVPRRVSTRANRQVSRSLAPASLLLNPAAALDSHQTRSLDPTAAVSAPSGWGCTEGCTARPHPA